MGVPGVWQSAALIGASELGDKTFFLSAIISMNKGRDVAFTGSMAALTVLTGASVALGSTARLLPPDVFAPGGVPLIDIAATCAFSYFGMMMLRDASAAAATAEEEQEEAEKDAAEAMAAGSSGSLWGALAATFSLVFVAEIGDKSMIATVALAKDLDATGVLLGAMAGNSVATTLAVVGGSSLSGYLPPEAISRIGGVLFLVFAAATAAKAAGLIEDD